MCILFLEPAVYVFMLREYNTSACCNLIICNELSHLIGYFLNVPPGRSKVSGGWFSIGRAPSGWIYLLYKPVPFRDHFTSVQEQTIV